MGEELITYQFDHRTDTPPKWDKGIEFVSTITEFPEDDYTGWLYIDDGNDVEAARNHLIDCIKSIQKAMDDGSRYLRTYDTKSGDTVVTIGGTTWGDSPCDEFDDMCAIGAYPELLEVIGLN